MSSNEFLLEIGYYDPVAVAAGTIRATTGLGFNAPDAPGFYAPSIQQAGQIDRTMWEDDQVYGSGKMTLGDAVLMAVPLTPSGTRPYDFLIANGCSVAGRTARLLIGTVGGTYASFVPLFSGTMEEFSFAADGSTVSFRWRDGIADLVEPTGQLHQFLGTNALPNGVEGIADLLGQWKPLILGYVQNVQLPCVNTDKPVYQLSDSLCINEARFKVYDKGSVLTKGVSRASVAALLAGVPGAGIYDYCLLTTGSYVALGSTPTGDVTADIVEGATAADRTVAQIWKRLLLAWGISSGAISAADVTALDTAQGGEAGYAMGLSAERRRDVLDKVVSSAGAIFWRDTGGLWRITQVIAATGSPVVTFRKIGGTGTVATATDVDILGIERTVPTSSNGAPVGQTTLHYAKNWFVQSKDSLAGVALPRLNFLSIEWRSATPAHDLAILAAYLSARILIEDTYFSDPTVTATEATRRQALRGTFRSWYIVTAQLDAATAALIQDLSVVNLVIDYYGLNAGKLGVVVRINYDAQAGIGKFTVYV